MSLPPKSTFFKGSLFFLSVAFSRVKFNFVCGALFHLDNLPFYSWQKMIDSRAQYDPIKKYNKKNSSPNCHFFNFLIQNRF